MGAFLLRLGGGGVCFMLSGFGGDMGRVNSEVHHLIVDVRLS